MAYHEECQFDYTKLQCKTEVQLPTQPRLELRMGADVYEDGKPSNCIIQYHKPWDVRLRWSFQGALAPCICGYWCVGLRFESLGPGPEFAYPPKPHLVDLNPCGNGCYEYTIRMEPGTIRVEHCSTPYKVVAVLTYLDYCKDPGPIVGFCELPTLQFYETRKAGEVAAGNE